MSKEKSVVVKNLRMQTKLCLQISFQAVLETNVLFTLNPTTHSSVLLLCVVRFNVNKTLQTLILLQMDTEEHGHLETIFYCSMNVS